MTAFEELKQEVLEGIEGKNSGIPMGFHRLGNHISIRKSMIYLLGGYTGSGKTSILDDAFVLNPMDYILKMKPKEVDLEIIYFSMERRKNFKFAKWICRRIFLDEGIVIPVNRMFGWVQKELKLTKDEHDLFLQSEDYISALEEKIHIISGPQNPMGIKKYVDAYALKNGIMEEIDEYHKKYIANDSKKVTLIIKDHIGLQKKEIRNKITYHSKKEIVDLGSEDERRFRDLYEFSCVDVSQFNRSIANPTRLKNGDVEPILEDFKDSGGTQEDADVVLSLFDPMRYKVDCPSGYDLDKLRDHEGKKFYRSLKILKNSYGSDDIRIGLAFQPEIGLFKEMPKKNDIFEKDYENITNNKYFLK